jgi:4-amino-4-deoxy-L-arabinose transferase-like glycosyltransferase
MSPAQSDSTERMRRARWWHEGEVLLLAALVVATYFLRIGDLSIRGEESRWATVAREMIRTGDWIVPRQQGEPFLSRPPLGNWLIAMTTLARGQCDPIAIRLPTVTAVLLTTILIYAFGRSFLNRVGALTAALAFCTMGEVLQMGRIAETDLVFTSLLSSAVIVWLWGERRGWPAWVPWCAGYALAALAALAKGPQAPVYFAGTVIIYCIVRGDWRLLFSKWHALGLVVFAAIVAAWQVPFTMSVGWPATWRIWSGDSAARFENVRSAALFTHLVTYPLEVMGCMAPWSIFLTAFFSRRFRASIRDALPHVQFLSIYFVLGFLPCWLSPGGMTRYCLPLYPAAALLVGIVAERVVESAKSRRLSWAWRGGWQILAASFLLIAAAVVFVSFVPMPAKARPWMQSPMFCLTLVTAAIVCAAIAWRVPMAWHRRQLRTGTLVVAGFTALTYSAVVVNAMCQRNGRASTEVTALKAGLLREAKLTSLNAVHHLFAYWFDQPIDLVPWPQADVPDLEWFCFSSVRDIRPVLPFAWQEIAVISVDRNYHVKPQNVVVVGRRIPCEVASQR